ncbi:hypothetical protein LDENG_00296570 [Lucifuga dentata]|nr:hypothetical protein LDENG_00296570 [Lucifuga dentata]
MLTAKTFTTKQHDVKSNSWMDENWRQHHQATPIMLKLPAITLHPSPLKEHAGEFACLSVLNTSYIHVTFLLTIFQNMKPYFSFPAVFINPLIFQNQMFR